jgi:hypothetical protein
MSLFDELLQEAKVFLPKDNNSTKRTTWDYLDADFIIDINILQLSPEEQILYEQEFASHKANVNDSTASQLKEGCRIDLGGSRYEVTNTPHEKKLFKGFYTIILKKLND